MDMWRGESYFGADITVLLDETKPPQVRVCYGDLSDSESVDIFMDADTADAMADALKRAANELRQR